ncbi:MAG: methylated-DNA--[protein]-cysteine S-methyltransferase [Candidatus Bathyarchaeota archaeon]|jgi:O-6-methylguanine DNA methyltransferase|nr:methylated-DNA--[protein]-cysteine S-methyltransferase [Candidatus Bathyarchaeota archaeon A05DMB-3]MDH7607280.1 methylated-DNA--[protein]-cysteine S-methyltransferase [Candidatus Bathyarchaeota archaeon]
MLTLYAKNVDEVWFGVACEVEKVFATAFAFSQTQVLQSLLESIPFNIPFQHSIKGNSFAEQVIVSLANIYNGGGYIQNFSLAMEHLSKYARKVLEAVALIPVGYVASYGSVAKAVGGSPRAVGQVMASNPFPLIVPCHRIVASNFSLGGYGGGLRVKLEILKREKRGYAKEQEIIVNGRKMQIFPVEFVLEKH